MPVARRNFLSSSMNQDADDRVLPPGQYRYAENIIVLNSEGSDLGTAQNSYSNKQLTNLNFGANPKVIGTYCDEFEDKIYWFVKSDSGCYLVEWDQTNEVASFVLIDTRAEGSRVLELDENHLITGIEKIISEDTKQDLLLWTDDFMAPCCINIERAKTYGENGFDKEDIYLIKKPPRFAPETAPTYQQELSNNMEEKFLLFAYRYRYLDGEYSALSDFTNYNFTPGRFNLNYYTLDNIGMLNEFNAVNITLNTGDKRVSEVQLVFKESNSNVLYLVETFDKTALGWGNDEDRNYLFSNNKIYKALPERELFRPFDNVPRLAKALTLIGNRAVFGNYLEGYDISDAEGKKINVDYSVSVVNTEIDEGEDFGIEFIPELADRWEEVGSVYIPINEVFTNKMDIANSTGVPLTEGNRIIIYIDLTINGNFPSFKGDYFFVLDQDYALLVDAFDSDAFATLVELINDDFLTRYNWEVPTGWVVETPPSITYENVGGVPRFTVNPVVFEDTLNGDAERIVSFSFTENTYVSISQTLNNASCKTNRDYEVGIVYMDEFARRTTVLTALYNTVYIPQDFSIFVNKLQVTINHAPPAWADRFKLVVKAKALDYQTLYINTFFNEDFYVWAKLEAENKDKIVVGDTLIVKRTAEVVMSQIYKVKVLEIKEQEKDFIEGYVDNAGNPVSVPAGFYMKIRPEGFSMDLNDYGVWQAKFPDIGSSDTPTGWLDLGSYEGDTPPPPYLQQDVPVGSSIYLYLNSSRKFDSGWKNNTYEFTYYAQRSYDTLEEFLNENVLGRPLFGNVGNDNENYQGNLSIVKGFITYQFGVIPVFNDDPDGKTYLQVVGTKSGGSKDRKGYVRAEIVLRKSTGFYVFETIKEQANVETFFETQQCFEIEDGNHSGTEQPQDVSTFQPAIITMDFFNCYTQGNGVESYRIKDGYLVNYLNIDTRPSSTSIEPYRSVRRYADMTYSEAFVESTNQNGLNVFNLSTGNFKELDKQYGSIQKLHSRDRDVLVLQEEKASKVLFGRSVLFNSDGTSNLTSSDAVLEDQVTYLGENGISKNPESFAIDDYRVYYANARRGVVIRLSIDGTTEIVENIQGGMNDFFRDLFRDQPLSKKIGGFDPYLKQYMLTVGNEPIRTYEAECGNVISKLNQSLPFTYILNLNLLFGDIVLDYNITSGNATITADFDGDTYLVSNVTGLGQITIPRLNTEATVVEITVTPVSETISYQVSNVCPIGINLKVVSIVIGDTADVGLTMNNRYRWGISPFYSENDVFGAPPITRFSTEEGVEGQSKFPLRGSTVNIQAYKDSTSSGSFELAKLNRLGYLVSSTEYAESDLATILNLATFPEITETVDGFLNQTDSATFEFNRASDDEILYLIWDYDSFRIGPTIDVLRVGDFPFYINDMVDFPFGNDGLRYLLLAPSNENYSDPNALAPNKFKITQLPTIGTLIYEGMPVNVGDEFPATNDASFNYLGDQSVFTYYEAEMKYRISNTNDIFSNEATVRFRRFPALALDADANEYDVNTEGPISLTLSVLTNDDLGELEVLNYEGSGIWELGDPTGQIVSIDTTGFTLGTVTINPGNLTLKYEMNALEGGTQNFTYTIEDSTGRQSTAIVTINQGAIIEP